MYLRLRNIEETKIAALVKKAVLRERRDVCRNIKTLFNYEPAATKDEIHKSALQYVRKISGFTKPSAANAEAYDRAVREIAHASSTLLDSLVTASPPRNRQEEEARAHERAVRRFG